MKQVIVEYTMKYIFDVLSQKKNTWDRGNCKVLYLS